MVMDDDPHFTMPPHFRCPISLDIMKSPVSLSTGVTYDRASIQRWLDAGNNTCPATMQLLPTKDLTPNHTLQRLIQIWSDSSTPPQTISIDQANQLLHRLSLKSSSFLAQNLSSLTSFAAQSEENTAFLAAAASGILPAIISLAGEVRDLVVLERIVSFCNILLKHLDSEALRSKIDLGNFDFKLGILLGLKQGRVGLRNALVKFLEFLAKHKCVEINSNSISEDDGFHRELLKLISTSSDSESSGAALSLLIRLAQLKRNRARIVRAGGVAAVAAAMGEREKEKEMSAASIEKALRLLEMLAGSKEGRNEIGNCVAEVVKKLLKVSGAATEHAVAVLWSLCCLHGDKRAAAAVVEGNGMGKVLVVMQSGCSPAVRRMCADLLRVLRCGSKTSGISWYDTKTTHIMPF
ncbi:U-box domain-containing protein 27-like isoform X1 [Salvia splendens]|uniref:U-box domain-containing protein 27-like isoform X1 n=1 Tax=Salvia splendens TaxID=180675 RepID=UPI0010FFD8A1|nr:U-box domain-containing protein 27-like isoform X1 [Salvia splendens]